MVPFPTLIFDRHLEEDVRSTAFLDLTNLSHDSLEVMFTGYSTIAYFHR